MHTAVVSEEALEAVVRLSRDLREASRTMSETQVRFMVDVYYQLQKLRISTGHVIRQSAEAGEPASVQEWLHGNLGTVERSIVSALDQYTEHHLMGSWMRSIYGIGPVLSAGLLAHIDMEIATNPSKIWRFAGLDPTIEWGKGQKRPYNARLKVICWKIADSFVKFSNRNACYYGHLYRDFKAEEVRRNDAGEYAELARRKLAEGAKATDRGKLAAAAVVWANGKLTDGHLDLRARRKTVKIFIVHLWEEWYRRLHHKEPPGPYVIDRLGHADRIPPPPN